MRKVLLTVFSLIIFVVMVVFLTKGVTIGYTRIMGIKEISSLNKELTEKIKTVENKKNEYTKTLNSLKSEITDLSNAKSAYTDLLNVSTDSQVRQATQTKKYMIEYLWSRVGSHATDKGVTIKMDITNSSLDDEEYKNLNFVCNGNYLALTSFISSLENDSNLNFTIDNFEMTNKQCKFTVKDVRIQNDKTSNNTQVNSEENEETETEEVE